LETLVRNKKRVREEFQRRLNSGVNLHRLLWNILSSCVLLKDRNRFFFSNYIFLWVCNLASHPKVKVVEGTNFTKNR